MSELASCVRLCDMKVLERCNVCVRVCVCVCERVCVAECAYVSVNEGTCDERRGDQKAKMRFCPGPGPSKLSVNSYSSSRRKKMFLEVNKLAFGSPDLCASNH